MASIHDPSRGETSYTEQPSNPTEEALGGSVIPLQVAHQPLLVSKQAWLGAIEAHILDKSLYNY